jgi:hypothetical protein
MLELRPYQVEALNGLARNASGLLAEKDEKRFWSKVVISPDTECLEWSAARNEHGYGIIGIGGRSGRNFKAHRVAYELLVGPIPEGLVLDHLCRNPPCVRPSHLEPVTHKVNVRRGKASYVDNTHCKHGHLRTPENTYVCPRGWPECKECRRIANRKSRGK